MKGIVKYFNQDKGYGFIGTEEHGTDVFAHFSAITDKNIKVLKQNQKVEFDIEVNAEGKKRAVNIKIVD